MRFMRLMQRAARTDAAGTPSRTRREPAHELYDQACELLFAAQALRDAAGTRGSAPAIAATIGCLDASLEALAEAVRAMRGEASRAGSSAPGAEDAGREFSEFVAAIASAHRTAGEMRERVGPMLAQLTLP
jgi:HAMP domain-containing protein